MQRLEIPWEECAERTHSGSRSPILVTSVRPCFPGCHWMRSTSNLCLTQLGVPWGFPMGSRTPTPSLPAPTILCLGTCRALSRSLTAAGRYPVSALSLEITLTPNYKTLQPSYGVFCLHKHIRHDSEMEKWSKELWSRGPMITLCLY